MRHFGTLPQVTGWLQRTHCTFGGSPWKDTWLNMLGTTLKAPAVVGATWEGFIFGDDVELNTFIHVERHPDGGWVVSESTENMWED